MKRIRKLLCLALVFAFLLMLVGCGSSPSGSRGGLSESDSSGNLSTAEEDPVPSGDVQTLDLGMVLCLTGDAGVVGEAQRDGFTLGIEAVEAQLNNQVEFNITIEDHQGTNDLAITAINKLVNMNGASLVVGSFSGPTQVMAPIAEENEVVLLNPGAQADVLTGLSDYLFTTIPATMYSARAMADYVYNELGLSTACIICVHSGTSAAETDDFAQAFAEIGGTVLSTEYIEADETDYLSHCAKVKQENPEFILLSCSTDSVSTQVLNQLNQVGLTDVTIGSLGITPSANFNAGMPNPVYLANVKTYVDEVVGAAYEEAYGTSMNVHAANMYNAALITGQAVQYCLDNGLELTGKNIHDALEAIATFDIMGGTLTLNLEDHSAEAPIEILDATDGQNTTAKVYFEG